MLKKGLLSTAIALGLTSISAAQDDGVVKDGTRFESKSHNLTLAVQKDWGVVRVGKEMKWKTDKSLCEGLSKDGNCAFILAYEEVGMTNKKYIESWEKLQTKSLKLSRRFQKKIPGKTDSWAHCQYDWPHKAAPFLYDVVFTTIGKKTYRLAIWYVKSMAEQHGPGVTALVKSFGLLEVKKEPSGKKVTIAKNAWKGWGPGSKIVVVTATKVAGTETKTKMSYELTKVTKDSYTLVTSMEMPGGMPPQKTQVTYVIDPSVGKNGGSTPKSTMKKLGEGTEKIKVGDKELDCKWTEHEVTVGGRKSTSKVWTSEALPVPVKSVTKAGAMESTMTVESIEKK